MGELGDWRLGWSRRSVLVDIILTVNRRAPQRGSRTRSDSKRGNRASPFLFSAREKRTGTSLSYPLLSTAKERWRCVAAAYVIKAALVGHAQAVLCETTPSSTCHFLIEHKVIARSRLARAMASLRNTDVHMSKEKRERQVPSAVEEKRPTATVVLHLIACFLSRTSAPLYGGVT